MKRKTSDRNIREREGEWMETKQKQSCWQVISDNDEEIEPKKSKWEDAVENISTFLIHFCIWN